MRFGRKLLYVLLGVGALALIGSAVLTILISYNLSPISLTNPLVPTEDIEPERPLQKYAFNRLPDFSYTAPDLTLAEELPAPSATTSRYTFTFTTLGKTMSGVITYPETITSQTPVLLMIRGYVPEEIFSPGVGTQSAANVFAQNGYITVAPDFFGYGTSDQEFEDGWEARFAKPVSVIELMNGIEIEGVPLPNQVKTHRPPSVGMWGHSNGGQIALSVLIATNRPIPTSLWAPVTAPFPYSVLFFSDENPDEGKALRLWLAQFEDLYDVFDFSITRHLDQITGPIQLHHGTADEAALIQWSDEFVDTVESERIEREAIREYLATASAAIATASAATQSAELPLAPLPDIELTYFRYPGADHNLRPSWQTVVERDLNFYDQHLR